MVAMKPKSSALNSARKKSIGLWLKEMKESRVGARAEIEPPPTVHHVGGGHRGHRAR